MALRTGSGLLSERQSIVSGSDARVFLGLPSPETRRQLVRHAQALVGCGESDRVIATPARPLDLS